MTVTQLYMKESAQKILGTVLTIVLIGGMLFSFKQFDNKNFRRTLLIFARFFGLLIIIIYTFDFAHFAYLHQRFNASVLSYADDTWISANMLWQRFASTMKAAIFDRFLYNGDAGFTQNIANCRRTGDRVNRCMMDPCDLQ